MADEDLDPMWEVLPPPKPDELRIRVETGENVELSDNLRSAIENLAAAVAAEESSGEAAGSADGGLQVGRVATASMQASSNYGGGAGVGTCDVNICIVNSGFAVKPGAIRSQ